MAIKGVIFGLAGIFFDDESGAVVPADTRSELADLFEFLREHDVTPIVLSNRAWRVTRGGDDHDVGKYLDEVYGPHRLYVTKTEGLPPKGKKELIKHILEEEDLARNELMYVGSSRWDFRAAVNSKLLFGNATWLRQEVEYGFVFERPSAVQAFLDVFALREHPWFFEIHEPVQVRALAPFSTYKSVYERYSRAARAAAKRGTPQRHFFLQSLVASVYTSGLNFNYIACVPGHKAGFGNPNMDDVLDVVGKVFNTRYLPDLVVRHTDAPKSQTVRRQGGVPSPISQLNTIKLTKRPLKKGNDRYKGVLRLKGKRVLVVDDFCTGGFSLEAVRLFLEEAGASVILTPWLKTINTPYHVLSLNKKFDPYEPQTFTEADVHVRNIGYSAHIVDPIAPRELLRAYQRHKRGC